MKKINVSIGLSVYNEEANIKTLLVGLLSQTQDIYKLLEVIIISDASSDSTEEIVKSFKSKKIKLIINKDRQGQQLNQNEIIQRFKGDVLVILEGDIFPLHTRTISELVYPFTENNNKLGLVVGSPVTAYPQTFFEKILFYGYALKYDIFNYWKDGINLYTAGGHAMRAISRDFAEKVTWPKDVPEDAYLYLRSRELDFEMLKQNNAKVLMRNVTNFSDRIKQCSKFQSGRRTLENYFDKNLLINEYKIPLSLVIVFSIKWFIKHPLWISLYFLEAAINRLLTIRKRKFNALYQPYQSSKNLSVPMN